MINYGIMGIYILAWVAIGLLVVAIVLAIITAVLERKTEEMKKELDEILRGED